MEHAIDIENISKRYRVGGLHPSYITFREAVAAAALKPFGKFGKKNGGGEETVWALKDVSFAVRPGEIVSVIGRNGAGKSTLLKILSRVTKPTRGRAVINGRIGSLLEVGTGFHPDLTGRENVFLSGAILGMRRAEISLKFDEIVAFAEVEKFIDTPVKWYSSGMYVRLAFSVAAHLEPEILMMDEVLAVGDAAFQQKCLDKMHQIRRQGRTILIVSHDMRAVTRLCKRTILLRHGEVIADGETAQVVGQYLSGDRGISHRREWPTLEESPGDDVVRLRRVRVRASEGDDCDNDQNNLMIDITRPIGVEITYETLKPNYQLLPAIDLYNEEGAHLFSAHRVEAEPRTSAPGRHTATAWIPGNFLSEGKLLIDASIVTHSPVTVCHAKESHAVTFGVVDNLERDSARGDYVGPMSGLIRPRLEWTGDRNDSRSPANGS